MHKVLKEGCEAANMLRLQQGKESIPTSFSVFSLPSRPLKASIVKLVGIQSLKCVTFIPQIHRRLEESHTGFYVNVFPWILWKRGRPVSKREVLEGDKAKILPEKERTLRPELKPAGVVVNSSFKKIKKEYDNRVKLLQ